MEHILNETTIKKILNTVDAGLSRGLGIAIPGHMCVEAAVCYALGLPHGDDPGCVGNSIRVYKIEINDAIWSSDKARAAGMRRLAVAQIGSDQINQVEFSKLVSMDIISKVLPIIMASVGLHKIADQCSAVVTFEEARVTAQAAAQAAAYSAAYSAAYAAAYAADAADSVAAQAAAYAAVYAAGIALPAQPVDTILLMSADIALQALIKLESPGCKFLYLCE